MDEELPRADAVAVRNGRIVAVGSREQVVARVGADYVIDEKFADRVMLPGLIDQHLHPVLAATTLTTEVIAPERWVMPRKTFEAASDAKEYRRLLGEAHQRLEPDEWLFSWGFHKLWHGELERSAIDEICGDRRVAIWQRTCHEWYLSTAALEAIGATPQTFEGHGFMSDQVDFDKGHFWENGAFALLHPLLMPHFATGERYREGLAQMIEYLHMNGVTAINEPGIAWSIEPWEMYQKILGADNVPFMSTFLIDGRTQSLKGIESDSVLADSQRQLERGLGSDKVHVVPGQVKLFCDGAGISQLMQMVDGYVDHDGNPDPDHQGEWLMEPDELRRIFDVYWDAGWQIHIHVTGDLGVEVILGVLADAQARKPRTDHRMVFVHFMNSTEEQVERIAELGGVVSINPFYLVGFADKFSEVGLGPARADAMGRSASVLNAGIPLSYHSDLPMCPSDPMAMAGWGAGRMTVSGRIAGPEQRISIHEALKAVTIGAAYSWQREHDLGSIAVGKIANFTVLDDDPYDCDATGLGDIRIRGSVFNGRWFPVPDDLIERRVENSSTAAASTPEAVARAIGHTCGCEVAQIMARHMTRNGWAA
jgi:predicted amidohydrolase YtcJ